MPTTSPTAIDFGRLSRLGGETQCGASQHRRRAFLPSRSEALPTNRGGAAESIATMPTSAAITSSPVPAGDDAVADEAYACIPPACNVALPLDEAELRTKAVSAIPLKELGYDLPVDHEMYGFDYDSAVAYLGPTKLLFTFNPHLLFCSKCGRPISIRPHETAWNSQQVER
jgi:hypothetical protein